MTQKPPVSKLAANLATTSILAEVFIVNSFHYLLPVLLWIKTSDILVSTVGFAVYLTCYGLGLVKSKTSKALNALRIIGSAAGFSAAFLFLMAAMEEWYFILLVLAALGASVGWLMGGVPTIRDPVHNIILSLAPFAIAIYLERQAVDVFLALGIFMLIFGIFIYIANFKVFLPRRRFTIKIAAPKRVITSVILLPAGIYTVTALLPLYGYQLLNLPLSVVGGMCFLTLITPFAVAGYLGKREIVVGPEILSSFVLVKIAFLIMAIYVVEAWQFLLIWVGLVVLSSLESGSLLAILGSSLKEPETATSLALLFPLAGGLGCFAAAYSWLALSPKVMFFVGAALCLMAAIAIRGYLKPLKAVSKPPEAKPPEKPEAGRKLRARKK